MTQTQLLFSLYSWCWWYTHSYLVGSITNQPISSNQRLVADERIFVPDKVHAILSLDLWQNTCPILSSQFNHLSKHFWPLANVSESQSCVGWSFLSSSSVYTIPSLDLWKNPAWIISDHQPIRTEWLCPRMNQKLLQIIQSQLQFSCTISTLFYLWKLHCPFMSGQFHYQLIPLKKQWMAWNQSQTGPTGFIPFSLSTCEQILVQSVQSQGRVWQMAVRWPKHHLYFVIFVQNKPQNIAKVHTRYLCKPTQSTFVNPINLKKLWLQPQPHKQHKKLSMPQSAPIPFAAHKDLFFDTKMFVE